MDIRRTSYSMIIDTLIFVIVIITIAIIINFFLNINDEIATWISFMVSLIFSSMVAAFVMEKYSANFPFRLVIKNERMIIYKLFSKNEILLGDIDKVSEIAFMSKLSGSITYEIYYNGDKIILNSKRYKHFDKLISRLLK